jgi:uncharacterized protein
MRMLVDRMDRQPLHNENSSMSSEEIDLLRSLKLIGGSPDAAFISSEQPSFQPTEATLFLTNQCNLRCTYCYASAGEQERQAMSLDVGEVAIDTIIRNARSMGVQEVQLGFHGGGEPTLQWDTLTHLATYCRKKAEKQGLKANISLATNGVLESAKVRWIIDNLDGANVSLDGMGWIHDHQRPLLSGGGSFDAVHQCIKKLSAHTFPHGIRCTVTQNNVAHLGEMADFVCQQYRCSHLHFEPVSLCGRCRSGSIREPKPDDFVTNFRMAREVTKGKGVEVVFSAVRPLTLTQHFCMGETGAFCVTPQGHVSSCYEVTDAQAPLADLFLIGHFDPVHKQFSFDTIRLRNLRNAKRSRRNKCGDCFCKYHCAGYCLARTRDQNTDDKARLANWCHITRELTKDALVELEAECRNVE